MWISVKSEAWMLDSWAKGKVFFLLASLCLVGFKTKWLCYY
jgi:hypothetical protein